jgi:undecaprenyl-diphosphatase
MPPRARTRHLAEAVALGALHGPTELLPVSSSGHTELIPWLLGWDRESLEPEQRKSFEVALHAGTAVGLMLALRSEMSEAIRQGGPRLALLVGLATLPPAVVGYGLEGPIERRLGTPASVAVGLILGAGAMAWADRSPQQRTADEAGALDAIWLGVAQACALMPGVSRNGATLTAARLRGFRRNDANRLSWSVALPVIAGATTLRAIRLRRHGLPAGAAGPFAAGAVASFVSTLASTKVIAALERDSSLLPYALYRLALGSLALRRAWRPRSISGTGPARPVPEPHPSGDRGQWVT